MPLPSNIKRIKIHPAIGIARQSPNEDYFIFGQQPAAYKSNNLIKRQAVQFTLVGYDDDNKEVEELTPERLEAYGLRAVWRADVANLKQKWGRENLPPIEPGEGYQLTAHARSDQNDGQLIGKLPQFQEGGQIPLGQITATGLFIPPLARVIKKDASAQISSWVMYSREETDNTCDGKISATLYDENSSQDSVTVITAWIIVAPPDFAPDALDPDVYNTRKTLEDFLMEELGRQGIQPLNTTARDREVLKHGTATFAPGIEASFGYLDIPSLFHDASETGDEADIRVRPHDGSSGAEPGKLTQGLCSPWQFDFVYCSCSYWAAHRPDLALQSQGSNQQVRWLRKKASDTNPTTGNLVVDNQDMVDHVHELGIVRGKTDRYETERTNDIT